MGGGYSAPEPQGGFEPASREVMPQFGESPEFPTDTPVPAPRVSMAEVRPPAEGYQGLLLQVVRGAHQRTGDVPMGDEVARARLRPTVEQVARSLGPLPPSVSPEQLTRDALAEIAGFGVFESLLEDASVTRAVLDPSGQVSVGRGGAPVAGGLCFSSAEAATGCFQKLLSAHGVQHDGSGILRASLSDGTRVTALFPPLAAGLTAIIERASKQPPTLVDLAGAGVLQPQLAQHLAQAVAQGRNIVVSGPCPAARDALLGALVAATPPGDRVATVTSAGGLGAGRAHTAALCADGRWDEVVSIARALTAPRNVLGEANAATARSFLSSLVSGTDGSVLAVDAPAASLGVSRVAGLVSHDHWLTRDEAVQRLHLGRVLVLETGRDAKGAPQVLSLSEVRADGGLQRLDG